MKPTAEMTKRAKKILGYSYTSVIVAEVAQALADEHERAMGSAALERAREK